MTEADLMKLSWPGSASSILSGFSNSDDDSGGVFFPSNVRKKNLSKRTHDLTGYSLRYSSSDVGGCLPFGPADGKPGSGVISAALGE